MTTKTDTKTIEQIPAAATHLTVVQRDTLRGAAFASAARLLRDAAEELELQASDPTVRDELDAIDALGWVDEGMAAQIASKKESDA